MRRAAPALLLAALAAGCAAPAVAPPPGASAAAGPVVLAPAAPAADGRYLGSDACRDCHPAAWRRWQGTAHAAAFAGLPEADRARTACLRCHTTGRDGGARVSGLDAVGCEACHGPGGDHGGSAYPGLVPTRTGGACPPCEVNRVCRLCHTPEHSPGFELARDLAAVSCRAGR